ncbi:MAG: tetratricopeptide repeat protein [Ignavibacteria bacterium]|nr:tetratricopeptide repeat protein [Ignavibacteria bacterium]
MRVLHFILHILHLAFERSKQYKISNVKCKILFLLLAPFSLLHAQTSEDFFQKGNELYRQGKFAEAISFYEKVLKKNEESGELYFNLGNAYYKMNDHARAILNYERAIKFSPNDEALNVNLQLANLYVTDNIEPIPSPFYWEMWNAIKSYFSVNQLSWFVVWFFIALLGSIAIFLYTRSFLLKRLFLIFNIIFLFLLVCSTTILVGNALEGTSQRFAVVLTDVVNVKTTPDDNSGDAFVIHRGVKVRLLDTVGDWREIKLADGKVGWMREKEFEEI